MSPLTNPSLSGTHTNPPETTHICVHSPRVIGSESDTLCSFIYTHTHIYMNDTSKGPREDHTMESTRIRRSPRGIVSTKKDALSCWCSVCESGAALECFFCPPLLDWRELHLLSSTSFFPPQWMLFTYNANTLWIVMPCALLLENDRWLPHSNCSCLKSTDLSAFFLFGVGGLEGKVAPWHINNQCFFCKP